MLLRYLNPAGLSPSSVPRGAVGFLPRTILRENIFNLSSGSVNREKERGFKKIWDERRVYGSPSSVHYPKTNDPLAQYPKH